MSKSNTSLSAAKNAKNDEFYTRIDDIQAELNNYRDQFAGKVVYCNCDDPAESAFADFFKLNFGYFKLKKVICTRYSKSTLFPDAPLFGSIIDEKAIDPVRGRGSYKLKITDRNGDGQIESIEVVKTPLRGDGDFRSPECIELLKEADIVCTNPPFSLFREYIAQLVKYSKKFLIIGNKNAISDREVFYLIKQNKLWLGNTSPKDFDQPESAKKRNMAGLTRWFTNLDYKKRHEPLDLDAVYDAKKYPHYDNYDAIEVGKTKEIPKNYFKKMGVPITYLDRYDPEQFEIIGSFNAGADGDEIGAVKTVAYTKGKEILWNGPVVEQKPIYKRIIIKRKVKK
jgi:hypothetical protein